MAETLPIVDAHYAAYGAGDLEALVATLADDFACGPLNGRPWFVGPGGARSLYAKTMLDYPLSKTTVRGVMVLGNTVVKRETSLPLVSGRPTVEALAIYTVHGGLIARLDMANALGKEGDALDLVARQLTAYNAQDLDAHCACFSQDVIVADLNGPISLQGEGAYRARYAGLFQQHPANHAELVARLSLNGVVIDHERVRRTPDDEPFEVLAIYSLKGDVIGRVDFVR